MLRLLRQLIKPTKSKAGPNRADLQTLSRHIVIAWAALMLALLTGGIVLDYQMRKQITDQNFSSIRNQLINRAKLISNEFTENRQEVGFLYSTPPIQGILRATANDGVDPKDGTHLAQWQERLQTIFVAFLETHPHVSQARYIGVADNGKELVRVDRHSGNIRTVSENWLQEKGDTDYMRAALALKPEQLYVSEINLNREYGELQFPYWPTYRIAMPVHRDGSEVFGLVILNVNATFLFDQLIDDLPEIDEIFLLDADGYFIWHKDENLRFGKDFDNPHTWSENFLTPTRKNRLFAARLNNNTHANIHTDASSHDHTAEETFYYDSREIILAGQAKRYLTLRIGIYHSVLQSFINQRRLEIFSVVLLIAIISSALVWFYNRALRFRITLVETQAEYEAIVGGSMDAIIGMKKDGEITSWNPGAHQLLGYPKNFAVGHFLGDFVRLDDCGFSLKQILNDIIDGKSYPLLEFKTITRQGNPISVSATFSPIYLGASINGVAIVMRDNSVQKDIEEKMLRLNTSLEQQVKERTQQLSIAKESAETANRMKGDFIANVSHEIRTPMNGVIGALTLLKKEELSKRQAKYLNMANTSIENLMTLINSVLDVSKIDSGKVELEKIDIDLHSLFSSTIDSLALKAFEKGVEVVLDLSALPAHTYCGDPTRIRQVLNNLLSNAIKFTDRGEIVVRTSATLLADDQVEVCLEVIDSGIGIADEQIDKLFNAFAQTDTSVTRVYGGTGLGLTIAKNLCELMQGTIRVTSRKGEGSNFTATMRLDYDPESSVFPQSIQLADARIVVADGHNQNLLATANQLRAWGAEVVVADSDCALAKHLTTTDAQEIDYLLIDYYLKNSQGDSWFEQLSAEPQWSGKVFLMACYYDLEKNELAVSTTQAVINKPIIPATLLSAFTHTPSTQPYPSASASASASAQRFNTFADSSVLLVDDNAINREVAIGLLEDLGLATVAAENGSEAIEELQQNRDKPIRVVLMDCQMPVMDGFTATQAIRRGQAGPVASQIPIIALTANAKSDARQQCTDCGMNDFIPKPVDPDELEEKIHYWLRISVAANPPADPVTAAPGSSDSNDTPSEVGQLTSLPEDIAILPIWDQEAALKRVRQKPERLQIMVNMFLDGMPERFERLHSAMASEEYDLVAKIAHEIKGVSANLDGQRLTTLSTRLEAASKAADKSAPELLESLDCAYRQLQRELANYAARSNAAG